MITIGDIESLDDSDMSEDESDDDDDVISAIFETVGMSTVDITSDMVDEESSYETSSDSTETSSDNCIDI